MSVTHIARNQIADYVCSLIDAGSEAGNLIMQASDGSVVATLAFSKPAFMSAINGTATANVITSDSNAAGGNITKAVAQDSDAKPVYSCSVTGTNGGGDIELSSVVIVPGQLVSLNSLTYSAPP